MIVLGLIFLSGAVFGYAAGLRSTRFGRVRLRQHVLGLQDQIDALGAALEALWNASDEPPARDLRLIVTRPRMRQPGAEG